jgi:hypothetical protein
VESFLLLLLYPPKIFLSDRWIRGRAGPKAGMDLLEKSKSLILMGIERRFSG